MADTTPRSYWLWGQSLSTFFHLAGNPYLIDLDFLVEGGLLSEEDLYFEIEDEKLRILNFNTTINI